MSDEPFQRPGTHPGGTDVHRTPHRSVWGDDEPEPEMVDLGDVLDPPEEGPKRGRLDLAIAATLGIAVGVAGTVIALNAGNGSGDSLPITPEIFPREVLGLLRDDLLPRDLDDTEAVGRLDANFARQVEGFRFAYGGDGAAMFYSVGGSGVEYTILNGILPPSLPSTGSAPAGSAGLPVVVSYSSTDVVCTLQSTVVTLDAETGLPSETDLASTPGWTSCVLTDGVRNLSLRLTELGVQRRDAARSAERMGEELRRLYEDLTS